MKDYIIISDSTCDLTDEITKEHNVPIIPLTVIMDKNEFPYSFDQKNINLKDFYQSMREGLVATTAQVNVLDAEKFFRQYLDKGLDVLYICFSSGLSGSFNSARLASENLKSEYPNNEVIVIDSLCASAGEGVLVLQAVQNKKNGMSFHENAKAIENIKLRVSHWFTVETVEYLRRGGRLSNSKAIIAKVLGIKPVLDVDNNGKLQPITKKHGRNQSLNELVTRTVETISYDDEFTTIVCNADCPNEAEKVKVELENAYKEKNIKSSVIVTPMGPIIGAHAGPGTVAVFSIGKGRV